MGQIVITLAKIIYFHSGIKYNLERHYRQNHIKFDTEDNVGCANRDFSMKI